MKSAGFLMLALAVAPVSAQAFDFSLEPDRTRYLSDPSYMQAKGELDGYSALGYSNTSEEHYLSDGTLSPKYTADTGTVTQGFTYGITNRLRVGISNSYKRQTAKDAYPAKTDSFDSSGFEDPTLDARVRVIRQGKAPFYLDVGASYSPDLLSAERPTIYNKGNAGRGNQTASGTLHIGREMKSLTAQLSLGAAYEGQKTEGLAGTSLRNTYSSHWNYGTSLDTQTRFTDRIFLNAGLGIGQNGSMDVYKAGQGNFGSSFDLTKSLYLSPGYQIIPNRLALTTEFMATLPGEETQTFSDHTEHWKNSEDLYVGLHLRYKIF